MRDPKHPNWPHEGNRTEDEAEANRWKWSYLDWLRGEKAGDKSPRIEKAMQEFRAHREKTVTATTLRNNNAPLKALEEWFAGKRVADIRTKDLQAMFDAMQAEGYKPGTLATNRNIMSAFFAWAGGANPARDVVIQSAPEPDEIYAWTDADIKRLRKAADTRGVRLMLEVALNTGVRLGELLALRWQDFDPDSKTVRISRQFASGSTRIVKLKGKKARTAIVLPEFWQHYRPEGELVMGRPLRDYQVYWKVHGLLEAAGVYGQQRGIHDARRTYGRLFLEMGGWMDELQRSLGHTSIRTTEKSYGAFQASVAAQFGVARIYGEGRLRAMR
jgi:integrase